MDSKPEPVVDDLPDPDLKIILLGDSAVGKSKLIERYLMDEYNPRQVDTVTVLHFSFGPANNILCWFCADVDIRSDFIPKRGQTEGRRRGSNNHRSHVSPVLSMASTCNLLVACSQTSGIPLARRRSIECILHIITARTVASWYST
jgi:GTPase SAR1 family protein